MMYVLVPTKQRQPNTNAEIRKYFHGFFPPSKSSIAIAAGVAHPTVISAATFLLLMNWPYYAFLSYVSINDHSLLAQLKTLNLICRKNPRFRQSNYAGINFIHNHPPSHPRGFAPKICPHPGAFAFKLFPEGRGFVGAAPEGRAFIYKRCLPFLKFSLLWQELATDNTLRFTCCSESVCVFKENYSIPDWTKAKKLKSFFWWKIDWECETVWLSGIWYWEYSGKSVCVNNYIKEIFIVLLTTDLWLSSI